MKLFTHVYGLCPVRGLNLGLSDVKQSELGRDEGVIIWSISVRYLMQASNSISVLSIYIAEPVFSVAHVW